MYYLILRADLLYRNVFAFLWYNHMLTMPNIYKIPIILWEYFKYILMLKDMACYRPGTINLHPILTRYN